jgi:16S rRNA (uracil1498-N3)-methyltransferase
MTLVSADANGVVARFTEPVPARVVGLTGVTLIQCAGKGDKVDEVVRAATALGASAIVIAQSERTVARGTPSDERRERLRAIALDAARQSGRGDLPELRGPVSLSDVLAEMSAKPALKLCLEPTAAMTLGRALSERAGRELVLLVGPEGGFSSSERDETQAAGFVLARLGTLVLRTELAGAAALGAVLGAE